MVTNGPTAELGRSLRSLQTVAFLSVRRGDEASVAAEGGSETQTTSSKPHRAQARSPRSRVETFITLPSPSGGFNVTFPPSLLQATSLESHQKWPSRRGWISKLHVISKLHYKYHSTELKQWVRCGFSDPTIFSSCRNNARISVQLSNYPVRRCPFCTRKLVNQVP